MAADSSSSWSDVVALEIAKEPSRPDVGASKSNIVREYRITRESASFKVDSSRRTFRTWRRWIVFYFVDCPTRVACDLFLPVGYPESVEQSYFSYQIYDSLQGLCSYLRGVVSTSAVLKAAGVGDAQATAISAAMTWAMRDGVGMIGGLCFSYFASPLFDANIKEWRLFADISNDMGLTLDMLAPYWGSRWFLLVSSLSTLCKVMCGISAGATKGSITQHFSRRGNVADLNAKESTQETLVSLTGMVLGVGLARFLHHLEGSGNPDIAFFVSWTIFILLTGLHVIANYLGVKLLKLRTLNRERTKCALQGLIDVITDECYGNDVKTPLLPKSSLVLSPKQVSESLLSSFKTIFYQGRIVIGTKLKFMFRGLTPDELLYYLNEFRDENYLITVTGPNLTVAVALRVGASESDALQAFVHAMVINNCLSKQSHPPASKITNASKQEWVHRSHIKITTLFSSTENEKAEWNLSFPELANKGWDIESGLKLGFGSSRIQWYGSKSE